jgi:hypothetical protein
MLYVELIMNVIRCGAISISKAEEERHRHVDSLLLFWTTTGSRHRHAVVDVVLEKRKTCV